MPDEVADVWPAVLPLIERGLDRSLGQYAPEDVLAGLLRGEFQLWLHPLGIVVTTISVYPQAKVCIILLCAGEQIHKWLPEIETIKAWARTHGCSAMRLHGRRGWKKTLGDGWENEVTMTYRLSDE